MAKFTNAKTAIKFLSNSYTTQTGQVLSFNDIELESVLISASRANIVVKTQVQGQIGTVKEYIGKDDWYITVSGRLTANVNEKPTDDMINLLKMLECPVVIDVVSEWLQNLGVHSLVVENYELPQMAGGESFQDFTIQFTSDTPIEIRISDV